MSSTNANTFNPDRTYNVKNNIDPSGREWKIHKMRQQGLYYARPHPDREDAVLPKILEGRFTKSELCQRAINTYLSQSWDKSELAQVKSIRAKEAKAEQANRSEDPGALTASEMIALAEADAPKPEEVPDVAEDMTEEQKAKVILAKEEAVAAAEDEGLPPVSIEAENKPASKSQAKRKAVQTKGK